MDQVPGVLAERPRALVVAWHTEAQVRGDSAWGTMLVRVPADRCKGGHIPFRLDVDQI